MTLTLLLQVVVTMQDLTPREHRVSGFVLTAPQELRVSAVGAEPWPDRLRDRDDEHWQDDEQTTWPAAAWILDARTRAVVWDLRAAETRRESNGLRRFAGTIRLPAGTYEAHYASFPASSISFSGNINMSLRDLVRLGRRARYGGPYVENGLYKEFALTIDGAGARAATDDELEAARGAFTATAIVSIPAEDNTVIRKGFVLTRAANVEVYALGELTLDGESDYGWIMNADTRKRVWSMTYGTTDPAGGAAKNRMVHETLPLKPGRYVAYYVSDDSHGPEAWNAVPATDPAFWGLTLRVADAAARASVKPFEYQPVPEGQTIVSLVGIGDDEMRSAGFALRRPMDVQIYAIGEGTTEHMSDYAWIIDADQHKRVWIMRYEDTEHAGGAQKNRLIDRAVHLEPGNYLVYYRSDGSHSADDWNGAPPAEGRYWGISLFPASGRLNPADIGPFLRRRGAGTDATIAQLSPMGNREDARTTFTLAAQTRVRVLAIGEGRDGDMYDRGWIEDAKGQPVWAMRYADTDPAGGADKNRMFDGVITLPAGDYVLRFQSDGSHSYNDWNDDPPHDPESWGIAVFRMARR